VVGNLRVAPFLKQLSRQTGGLGLFPLTVRPGYEVERQRLTRVFDRGNRALDGGEGLRLYALNNRTLYSAL
jgi:hypothetical protein